MAARTFIGGTAPESVLVIERAAALRLPAIYEWPEMAEEGGLIAYGPGLPAMYRQAARLAAKVLQGATSRSSCPQAGISDESLPAGLFTPDPRCQN
jgi:ABC-type uncharacterized transport system substrate-binding protein